MGCMSYGLFDISVVLPPPPLLVFLADVVTEALSLAGRMLIIIVGQGGDAFFVPDVFGREQRC